MSKIQEVYDRYRHLDRLLSDRALLPEGFIGEILRDLWQAAREDATDHPPPEPETERRGCAGAEIDL